MTLRGNLKLIPTPGYHRVSSNAQLAGLELTDGQLLPVSQANEARMRWNVATSRLEASLSGAAYVEMALAGAGGLVTDLQPGTVNAFGADPDTHMVFDGATPGGVPTSRFAIDEPVGVFRPESYGAVGDGVTDDGAAIVAATAACVAAGGGVVEFGSKVYLSSLSIDPGVTSQVTFRGQGWRCTNMAGPGDASWTAGIGTTITGTVIHYTGAGSCFTNVGANGKGTIIENLAIVGPGLGAVAAVNWSAWATFGTQMMLRNVMLANFADGLRLGNTYDNSFYDVNIYGCTNAVHVAADTTEQKFYSLRLQSCDVAALFEAGADIRIFGGLVQGCKLGHSFAPSGAGGISCISVDGTWFEGPAYDATAQVHFGLDSTNGTIAEIAFTNCRCSTACTVTPTVVDTIARVAFVSCDFAGITLVYDADMSRFAFINSKFAEVQQSGGGEVAMLGLETATPNAGVSTLVRHFNPEQVLHDDAALAIDWRTGDTRFFYLDDDGAGAGVDVTVGIPSNAPDFAELTLLFQQRGAVRNLLWAAGYHVQLGPPWTDSGFAAVKLIHVSGGQWIQVAGCSAWSSGVGTAVGTGAAKGASRLITDVGSPHSPTADDYFLRCDTSAGNPLQIDLPQVNVSENRYFLIHDWGGTASVDNITIAAQGGETVDGVASIAITTDGAAALLYCDGIEWRTVPTM
jgi:hypothetical protein